MSDVWAQMIYSKQEEAAERKGNMKTAIKNAKRRMSMYRESVDKPSIFDLGTTVHELVEELMKKYLLEIKMNNPWIG